MLYDKNIHQINKKAYECISEMNPLGDPGWNETSVTQSRNYSLFKTKRDGPSDMRPYKPRSCVTAKLRFLPSYSK